MFRRREETDFGDDSAKRDFVFLRRRQVFYVPGSVML